MSTHRHPFRRQAETDSVVAPVLDALRAPARDHELRREDATVAAFHSARLTPTSTRSDMSTTARSAATRAAIATGVVVALSTGGFALAATDHLPTLPDQASDRATESVAKNRATSAPTTTATTATTAPTTTATTTETEEATPTPSLKGLCNAFQAHKKLDGAWLDSSAFTALATAAGSKEGIAAYCVTLVGEPKVKATKAAKPTKEAKPTKAPKTDKVKPTPTNKPTAQPTPAVKGTSADKGKAGEKGKSATAGTR